MIEKIDVQVLYSADDYARGFKYIQRRNLLVKYAFLLPLAVITLSLIWLYFLDPVQFISTFSQVNNLIVLLFVPLIVVPLFYFVSRRKSSFLARRQFAKQIASSPAMQAPQSITFDHNGIEGQTTLSSGMTKWEAIIEATETEDDFYFFTGKKFAMFIPKRVLADKEQDDLHQLLFESLGQRVKKLH
jgi:hypothetical protein